MNKSLKKSQNVNKFDDTIANMLNNNNKGIPIETELFKK